MPQLLASSISDIEVPVLLVISAIAFMATVGVAAGVIIGQVRKVVDELREIVSAVKDLSARVVRLEVRFEDYAASKD